MTLFTKIHRIIADAVQVHEQKTLYARAMTLLSERLADTIPCEARAESPVIIIGMHRSGTTLTTRLLEDLGVAMGAKQCTHNSEDLFFQKLNKLVFALADSTWDNPEAVSRILHDDNRKTALTQVISALLQESGTRIIPTSPAAGEAATAASTWGFKDPRSTYTLPIWLAIFPNARVINIIRDGKKVSSSLLQRGRNNLQQTAVLSFVSLSPSLSLDLWADYVATAEQHCSALPDDRYFEFHYETLLAAPEATIQQLAEFLHLDTSQQAIVNAAARVRHSHNPGITISDAVLSAKARQLLATHHYE